MIQIIVVTASVLLGLMLYPILVKTYTRIITKLYKSLTGETIEKKEEILPKKDQRPSIIGKSKFNLSQSKPNATTVSVKEAADDKVHNFAPESVEEPNEMDIDVPLEKVEYRDQEVDIEEEEEELGNIAGADAILASGVVFDELHKVKQVIEKADATSEEEQLAGKILSENRNTALVGHMLEGNSELSIRISYLIDIQDKALATEKESKLSKKEHKELNAEDFKNFDVNTIF